MSVLQLFVNESTRKLSNRSSNQVFVVNDANVDTIRFSIPAGFSDIDINENASFRVMYIPPGIDKTVYAKTLTFVQNDGVYISYDWQVGQNVLVESGILTVSFCILKIEPGLQEWHTVPYQIPVSNTIHTDDSDEGDESITPTVAQRVAVLETMIQRVASGAPIVVTSTSAMTDTDQIYVLSTDRKWYYHNGTAWVAGGEYGAVATDTTLTQAGMAADAKAVGDKIADIKDDIESVFIQTVALDLVWSQGNISDSTGIPSSSASVGAIRTDDLYDVSDVDDITVTFSNGTYPDTIVATIFLYDGTESFLSKTGKHPGAHKIDVSSASYIRVKVARNDSITELSPSDGNLLVQASKKVPVEYASKAYVDSKVNPIATEIASFESAVNSDVDRLETAFEAAFVSDLRMPLVWSQGNISDSTGVPSGTTVGAIRTDAFYDISNLDTIKTVYNNGAYPSTIVFTVFLYDSSQTFLSKIGKYAGTYNIDVSTAAYIKFKIARNDSVTEISPDDGDRLVKVTYRGEVTYASEDYVDEKVEPLAEQVAEISGLEDMKPIKTVTLGWQAGKLSDSGTESGSSSTVSIRCVYAVPVDADKLTLTVANGYKADVHFYTWYVYKDSTSHYSTILKNQTGTVEIDVPEGYGYVRLVLVKTDGSDISTSEGNNVSLAYIDGDLGSASTDFVNSHSEYISLAMFQKIGVVGDSFASGTIGNSSYYDLSWPQVMGRKIGAEVTNYTEGGLSTKDWLTDTNHGLPALLADSAKQLYILGLGINDNTQINAGTLTLGTLADITDDYTQNPESFYGNYGRIIGNIQTHAPSAKIVILSIARPTERNMDTHLQAIAEKCALPYIQLTDNEYFNSGLYFGSMVSNHPLAYGYAGMANAIQRLIEKSVADNTAYFVDYKG